MQFGRPTANKNKADYAIELYNAGHHTIRQIVKNKRGYPPI